VIVLIVGCLALLGALGLGAAAGALAAAGAGLRDDQGFLMSGDERFASAGYAIESASMQLDFDDPGPFVPDWLLGDAKITATSATERALFLGLAPTREVDAYLAGVERSMVMDLDAGDRWHRGPVHRDRPGGPPHMLPHDAGFWSASSSGTGSQTVTWPVESGDWTLVVMNADGARGVAADISIGATFPALGWLVGILLAMALLLLLLAALLLFLALRSAGRAAPTTAPDRVGAHQSNPGGMTHI
jgi:hypothetical protein